MREAEQHRSAANADKAERQRALWPCQRPVTANLALVSPIHPIDPDGLLDRHE
jgi:hypothetical protein